MGLATTSKKISTTLSVGRNRIVATENGHDKSTVTYASKESETEQESGSTRASQSQNRVKSHRVESMNASHPQNKIKTTERVDDDAS